LISHKNSLLILAVDRGSPETEDSTGSTRGGWPFVSSFVENRRCSTWRSNRTRGECRRAGQAAYLARFAGRALRDLPRLMRPLRIMA